MCAILYLDLVPESFHISISIHLYIYVHGTLVQEIAAHSFAIAIVAVNKFNFTSSQHELVLCIHS